MGASTQALCRVGGRLVKTATGGLLVGMMAAFVITLLVDHLEPAWAHSDTATLEKDLRSLHGMDAPPPDGKLNGGPIIDRDLSGRLLSGVGILVILGLAIAMSNNRRLISWRLVAWGLGLQFAFGVIILRTELGEAFFYHVNSAVMELLSFTEQGARFIFGNLVQSNIPVGGEYGSHQTGWAFTGSFFAFNVLPTIIFFSSLMTVLYHLGIMQRLVAAIAVIMHRTMHTSGAESLSAAGNIFVGQTEAPLMVKPFLERMTESELMTVMTGGFATIAGGVLVFYVGLLRPMFPDIAGHLLAASVMSAPAALLLGKIMIPETQESETAGGVTLAIERPDANVIDAAARGAGEGLRLALNVGAMLLAFIALVALLNAGIGWLSLLPMAQAGGLLIALALVLFLFRWLETRQAKERSLAGAYGVSGVLVAVVGLVSLLSSGISSADSLAMLLGQPLIDGATAPLQLETLLGHVLAPLAWLMGVPWADCQVVGQLLGVKTILNELLAYQQLAGILPDGFTSGRSVIIVTYSLCGFANFSSIAIQIGGIGGIAPSRTHDLARIGLRAMIAGNLAAFMTGTVAGVLI